jgi:NAD(P)-dependent dehydrogenase (short-subunit alcohol dehydrogenase family)
MEPVTHDGTGGCALVVGVGANRGIGAALCRRFSAGGLHVYAASRSPGKLTDVVEPIRSRGGSITPVLVDTTDASSVQALFERIDGEGRALELVAYNVGKNTPRTFLTTTPEFFEQVWREGPLGGFLIGREAVRRMLARTRGTLLYTGASGSLRGKARYGAFASGKAGLRALAQGFAQEFGPRGIHVGHVIVDGLVSGERIDHFGYGLGFLLRHSRGRDGALLPEAIAENYWQLHCQPRTAWTHELDLRPYKEAH